ncbi:MAG: M48 family metalloprotease [Myxococcaceae bacterium]
MTRSTLVLVMALACSCRPSLQSRLRSDTTSIRSMAAEADALRAQQAACHAKRSQVFTEGEVQVIGEHALSKWLAGRKTAPEARLSRVAMRLHAPPRSWEFLVVEDAKVDSFSVPPSTVLVTHGLLAALSRDGALAGVVAHELAHLTANDALELLRQQNELRCLMQQVASASVSASHAQQQQLGMNVALDPNDSALTTMADSLVQSLMKNGYGEKVQATSEDERAADAQAARWLHAAGFDVREYEEALATLDGLSVPHPAAATRVEALEALRPTLPPMGKPKK